MKQIVADSSAYYLLGYNSTQAPQDGKFHEIKVRVKRSGTEVRARKGYWALTRGRNRARQPHRRSRARRRRSAGRCRRSPSRRAAASSARGSAPTRGANGKTRVTFVWEPIPAQPGVRRDNGDVGVADRGLARRGDRVPRQRRPRRRPTAAGGPPADCGHGATVRRRCRSKCRRAAAVADVGQRRQRSARQRRSRSDRAGSDGHGSGIGTPRVYVARTAREFQAIMRDEIPAMPTADPRFPPHRPAGDPDRRVRARATASSR